MVRRSVTEQMAIAIQPYSQDFIDAVRSFNSRLATVGVTPEFRFPEHHVPHWLPKVDGRRLYQEYFLAVENGSVRGGYILKHQDFFIDGQTERLAYYHLPLSEGIINNAYASVGVQMLRHALKAQPLLFALGMGGFDRPLPKMLKAMGWSMRKVPFYFKVNHPNRFFRELRPLRNTPSRRLAMDIATFTGVGWVGLKCLQRARASRTQNAPIAELVDEFSGWADELAEECRARYLMMAHRDRDTLRALYPPRSRFLRLRITGLGKVLGWAMLLDTQMSEHRYFGSLRVGSIIDCLSVPENAAAVIAAATQFLQTRGTDLIVSNQSHTSWCAALKSAGFLQGPSNFVFAASKALSQLLSHFETNCNPIHLNRGDGDGPINL